MPLARTVQAKMLPLLCWMVLPMAIMRSLGNSMYEATMDELHQLLEDGRIAWQYALDHYAQLVFKQEQNLYPPISSGYEPLWCVIV